MRFFASVAAVLFAAPLAAAQSDTVPSEPTPAPIESPVPSPSPSKTPVDGQEPPRSKILHLTDGSAIVGEVIESRLDTVVFRTKAGTLVVEKVLILRIVDAPHETTSTPIATPPATPPATPTAPPPAPDSPSRELLSALDQLTFGIAFAGGGKRLSPDWEPVDTQQQFGFEANFGAREWVAAAVFGRLFSSGSASGRRQWNRDFDYAGKTEETYGGAEGNFPIRKIHVSPAGGLSLMKASFSGTGPSDDDYAEKQSTAGVGAWLAVTGSIRPSPHVRIGATLRYSYVPVELFAVKGNAGGAHLLVRAGIQW